MNRKATEKKAKVLTVLICFVLTVTYIPILPNQAETNTSYIYADTEGGIALTDSGIDDPDQGNSEDPEKSSSDTAIKDSDTKTHIKDDNITLMTESKTTWYNPEESLFVLSDEKELQGFAEIVNKGQDDFTGKTVVLDFGGDIHDFEINPIGNEEHPFAGTFDGGTTSGTSISNIKIATQSNNYVGLFGYTTSGSIIKNLDIGSSNLTVTESNKNGSQIRYVGSVVGYCGGDLENCESNVKINITSSLTLGKHLGIIRNVGGITGYISGKVNNCKNYGDIAISSDSNVNDDCRYLVGEVGGIAGSQGDVEDPMTLPVIDNCINSGDMDFRITGSGGIDRFGAQLYSVSFSVGGIVGQTSGVVKECNNSGEINTSNNKSGKVESGRGAANTGGIVGNLRKDTFDYASSSTAQNANYSKEDAAYKQYKKNGGAGSAPGSYPKTAGVYDCTNTGTIIGLNAVGGIVGSGGSFTEIEGCANKNPDSKTIGCRWNKPFAAGIAGTIQGDIRYCYNRSGVESFTGGGYYCAGIAGGLWVPQETTAADNDKAPTTEMTGCYTTGDIYTAAAGYKTGILAGENEGFIHDNVYWENISSKDNKLVDSDSGTTVNNTKLSTNDLKGSKGISLLNTYAAGKGNWAVLYLPSDSTNSNYPILSRGSRSITNATQIPSGTASVEADASYSASAEPIPRISITVNDNIKLIQNADFYIIPEANAKMVSIGTNDERPYTATIHGMGKYSGDFSNTIAYGITKGNINECTIVADSGIFNWKVQRPTASGIKLIDSAGEEIDKSEYMVSDLYDPQKGTEGYDVNPDPNKTEIHYYDYINCHGPSYKYDVCVMATDTSNYRGSTTQPAFRINWASMMAYNPNSDTTKPESVRYGDVMWKGKTWNFLKAMEDTSGNTIKITYTGKPITPTVTSATYLGKELRLATDYDYQSNPLNYDYKYIYGNPNPETTGGSSFESVNVTSAGSPSCMTIRFTNGGNFDNYVNVFFHIIPANINSAKMTIAEKQYTGKAIKPKPTITYNGMTLKEKTDFILSNIKYSSNKLIGKATMTFTVTGKGNYTGSYKKAVTFKINPKKTKIKKLTSGKKTLKISFKKVSKAQSVTGYQIRYKIKGKTKWAVKSVKANKNSLTIKKLKKNKKYQVQVRAVKKIKKGASKGIYYGAWSKTKTSKKVK